MFFLWVLFLLYKSPLVETGCLARVLSLLHAADRQTDKQLVLSQCGPNRPDVWAASTCRSRLAFIVNSQWAYSETTFICLPALPLHYFVLALKYCVKARTVRLAPLLPTHGNMFQEKSICVQLNYRQLLFFTHPKWQNPLWLHKIMAVNLCCCIDQTLTW